MICAVLDCEDLLEDLERLSVLEHLVCEPTLRRGMGVAGMLEATSLRTW